VGAKQLDPPRDAGTLPAPLRPIGTEGRQDVFGDVPVAEAIHGMFSPKDGLEQGLIVPS